MLRLLGVLVMAIVFLFISPNLRGTVMDILADAVQGLEKYSPVSYVALGLVCLGAFFTSVKRGSAPR
jgi:hypothetical protein